MAIDPPGALDDYLLTELHLPRLGPMTGAFRLLADTVPGIRDIVGGRSAAYEKELGRARQLAFEEMQQQAREMGGNAIVGIDIDYETVGDRGSMLMVSVSGTAVSVR